MAEPVTITGVISIKNLSYRYRGEKQDALSGIDLDVRKGEYLVVMGPSMAGKSTLASCLNGLIPHFHKGKFRGEVHVMEKDTREQRVAQLAEKVGMVFQDFEAQLFSTSVELEVAFGPENFCVGRQEIGRRIEENLSYVGLGAIKNRPPSTLSGGQKQKLAIASVLAIQPKILVMDEPTTDLDPISKMGIFDITERLRKRHDITLIVVEHDTEEVLKADRVLFLKDGQIVRIGPSGEMLRDVDLMEKLGLMPLGVPKFFHRMELRAAKLQGAKPSSSKLQAAQPPSSREAEFPLTPEEGVRRFQAMGFRLSEENYQRLLEKDTVATGSCGEEIIRCRGLKYTYSGVVQALRGVDLEIHRGEMLAIVGQNGSGKTTLVRHFNGLLMPTKGQVEVEGKPTKELGVYVLGQKVGYVFQNPDHQIFSETVFDEVAYSPRLRGLEEEQVKQRVSEALEAVGLAGCEQDDPFSMTKSGRQRVAVASVLAAHPEVLILDEPTTGLDYSEQRSMMEMVKQLNEQGSTIIFVTHHMWVVAEYSQRVIVLKDGAILLQGPTREVFAKEKILRDAYLRPPHVVSLSNRLGKTLLTVGELVYCTERGR